MPRRRPESPIGRVCARCINAMNTIRYCSDVHRSIEIVTAWVGATAVQRPLTHPHTESAHTLNVATRRKLGRVMGEQPHQ